VHVAVAVADKAHEGDKAHDNDNDNDNMTMSRKGAASSSMRSTSAQGVLSARWRIAPTGANAAPPTRDSGPARPALGLRARGMKEDWGAPR
jgi:hypothetical protein